MSKIIVTCPKGHIMVDNDNSVSVLAIDLSNEPVFMRYYCEVCAEWFEIEIKERENDTNMESPLPRQKSLNS